MTTQRNPWPALYALVVGFFVILLDMTIVAVANPAIMQDLHADVSQVIWVTSAYLLLPGVILLIGILAAAMFVRRSDERRQVDERVDARTL